MALTGDPAEFVVQRAAIMYDQGQAQVIDIWLAATQALMGHYPNNGAAQAKAALKASIDRYPDELVGQRPRLKDDDED
jgi:hypothetical protein